MGRKPRRGRDGGYCYHVTHRCQQRSYLLKFRKDRDCYLERLREARDRYGLNVLDYMITCNHIHLLIWTEKASYILKVSQRREKGAPGSL